MEWKIFLTGNRAVVSLPPEVLEATGLERGDEVTVTVSSDRGRIVLTRATAPGTWSNFLDCVDRFMDRYQPSLKALARE